MKKIISALLSLVLVLGLCCPELTSFAAGSSASSSGSDSGRSREEARDYLDGVVNASELFYINGVVFWGYRRQLCSALIDGDGGLYDFVSEGSLSSNLSYVASDGDNIYMSTDDGLISMSLDKAGQERAYLSVLDDHKLSSGFQLYGKQLFFRYGSTLYSLPVSGGESTKLEKEIRCFQVTTQGIYCLNDDGDLLLISLDGNERSTLCRLDSQGDLGIFGGTAYITTGDDEDFIYCYDLAGDSLEKLELEETISGYYPVWVEGDDLYYRTDEGDIRRMSLSSGKEQLCQGSGTLPDYDEGFLLDGFIYFELSDTLHWAELDGPVSMHLDSKDALSSGSASSPAKSSASYDIAENITAASSQGLSRLESDHFCLYLPADSDWEYQVMNKRWVDINYAPARKAGYGGNVVSIAAYDSGDTGYTVFPHYAIAGEGGGMVYVAIFPTDVQFSPETEEGWRQLSDYVRNIDADNKNNPFSCS